MTLPAEERRRYLRQMLLPEIGEAGQARLRGALAVPPPRAESRAAAVCADYLARAGVGADPEALRHPERARETPVPDAAGVRDLAGEALLGEAAAALAGAFAAVETMKGVLAAGRGGGLDGVRLTTSGPGDDPARDGGR